MGINELKKRTFDQPLNLMVIQDAMRTEVVKSKNLKSQIRQGLTVQKLKSIFQDKRRSTPMTSKASLMPLQEAATPQSKKPRMKKRMSHFYNYH
jgi:hypothetical protein